MTASIYWGLTFIADKHCLYNNSRSFDTAMILYRKRNQDKNPASPQDPPGHPLLWFLTFSHSSPGFILLRKWPDSVSPQIQVSCIISSTGRQGSRKWRECSEQEQPEVSPLCLCLCLLESCQSHIFIKTSLLLLADYDFSFLWPSHCTSYIIYYNSYLLVTSSSKWGLLSK
jgi:hypothetical protein